jgi:hypothetical protein
MKHPFKLDFLLSFDLRRKCIMNETNKSFQETKTYCKYLHTGILFLLQIRGMYHLV